MFLARRLSERTWEQKDGELVFLALDWAKAFDSVSPEALLQALSRFGVPDCFVEAVAAVYSNRSFSVRDCGSTSDTFP